MARLKILRIVNELTLAGLEVGIGNIVLNLNREKYENVLVCIKNRDKNYVLPGIKVYELNKKKGLGLSLPLKISRIIRKEKPSVLQMHNADPFQQGMLASLISNVPIKIYIDHNSFEAEKSKKAVLLDRFLARRLNSVVAVSEEVKRRIVSQFSIQPEKVKVILNGTDLKKFNKNFNSAKIKKELGLKKENKIITIIAGLRPVKDHISLIKAFSYVVQKEKNAKLLIVGEGDTKIKEGILNEIKAGKLNNNVCMLSLREDIPEILAITDVSVLSSLSEGTSQTIMESMAASRPVVATNVGGNCVLIEDGKNGLLVPPKDPEEMADAILRLLGNKKLRENMGREGKKRVQEYFNINRVVKDYEQLYDTLLRKKGLI